jgi:hypothetical protein
LRNEINKRIRIFSRSFFQGRLRIMGSSQAGDTMAAEKNSDGNKSLNDRKRRAAGRQKDRGPEAKAIRDFQGKETVQRAGGASGRGGIANRKPASVNQGGGGGGANAMGSDLSEVGRSTKAARKRGSARARTR